MPSQFIAYCNFSHRFKIHQFMKRFESWLQWTPMERAVGGSQFHLGLKLLQRLAQMLGKGLQDLLQVSLVLAPGQAQCMHRRDLRHLPLPQLEFSATMVSDRPSAIACNGSLTLVRYRYTTTTGTSGAASSNATTSPRRCRRRC